MYRDGAELHSGQLSSLKHFKDDVREVNTGFEGGLMIENFSSYEEGDVLESRRLERVR